MVFLLFFVLGCGPPATQQTIYGYVEKATLLDSDLTLSAKLDTGAKSASISAIDIREIEIKNKPYLRFNVVDNNKKVEFTCEYVGKVRIKSRVEEPGTSIKRPIVLMRVKIGDKERTLRVNLANRKAFNYPLLLGRDAIVAFEGIINPKNVFLIKTPTEKNAVQ